MGVVPLCPHLTGMTHANGPRVSPPLRVTFGQCACMSPPSRDTSSGIDLPTVCWPCRVDPDCISPDVKNSIHVGDRILEINGTPIGHVPLDEVGSPCAPQCVRPFGCPMPPHVLSTQIDLLIQETSRLLQLTIEHDPHEPLPRDLALPCSPLPDPHSPLRSPVPAPHGDLGTMRQRAVM